MNGNFLTLVIPSCTVYKMRERQGFCKHFKLRFNISPYMFGMYVINSIFLFLTTAYDALQNKIPDKKTEVRGCDAHYVLWGGNDQQQAVSINSGLQETCCPKKWLSKSDLRGRLCLGRGDVPTIYP